jgi:uncharacterized membrane protein YczE
MSYVVSDQKSRPISATISIILAIITAGYFIPWMVAALRGKSNAWTVFWVNFLLGWTLIGWIVALVIACGRHQAKVVSARQVPGSGYYPPPSG